MSNNWLENAKRNLFPLSEEKKDFIKATSEWIYRGLEDNDDAEMDCELCEHDHIRYEYTIVNQYNDNELIVGSTCIEKFIDHVEENDSELLDTTGEVVAKERMYKEREEFWKKLTIEILEEQLPSSSKSDFKQNIIAAVEDGTGLTCNQTKCLKAIYNRLKDESKAKTAMHKSIKVRLKKKAHKEQYFKLNESDRQFVRKFLSSAQIKRMEGQ